MDPAVTEAPPGCLVVLIPLSAGMTEGVRVHLAHRYASEGAPDLRDLPRGEAARFLADELVEGLVNALAQGYAIPLEVAVLGYGAGENDNLKLVSLLPGTIPAARFVPLADLAGMTVEPRSVEGDPRHWTSSPAPGGAAPAALAMAEVHRLVSVWLTGRYSARPPVIIHCTSTEGLDEAYSRIARSLGALQTVYGLARILHYGFVPGVDPILAGTWPEPIPEPWAALAELSAELPAEPEGRPARRAVSLNDWTVADAWSALFDLVPVEAGPAWSGVEPGRFGPDVRVFWAQKLGNKPEEWEDAFATHPPSGTVVVADGASSGIYCRIWADQLTKRFVSDRPDARAPLAFGKWVHGLRGEWRSAINYPTLNWAKQRKVDEVGAAATLLALEVGPADEAGQRPWRASAVGDACVFWVRDGRLQASFPVVASDQFGSAPLLVRSNPGFKTLALIAGGVCRPGDRFLLATDAVASRLLKLAAAGAGPDWDGFESLEDEAWHRDMDEVRRSHEMVNDDCTLVAIQIAAPGAVNASETPAEPAAAPTEAIAEPTGLQTPLPADGEAQHVLPGIEENGTAPPAQDSQEPNATEGYPRSTDNTV